MSTMLVKRSASLLAAGILLALPSFAATVWECTHAGGCEASWLKSDGTWEKRKYEKGMRIIVGDGESVELGTQGWSSVP